MKKFLLAGMMLLVFCFSASAENFTPQQAERVQLELDIFSMCIVEEVYPYVQFGFTTERAVAESMEECKTEGINLIHTLLNSGATEKEASAIMKELMRQAIVAIDEARNAAAQARVDKVLSEKTL